MQLSNSPQGSTMEAEAGETLGFAGLACRGTQELFEAPLAEDFVVEAVRALEAEAIAEIEAMRRDAMSRLREEIEASRTAAAEETRRMREEALRALVIS